MGTYADSLANFLEWAETREVSLNECEYITHLWGAYQQEMLNGEWSGKGKGLKSSTVNLRVHIAGEFLTWMSSKGLRRSFNIPYVTKTYQGPTPTDSKANQPKKIRSRKGKASTKKTILNMPPKPEVLQWLERVKNQFNETCKIMCQTVLLTAIRREELVCLRNDTLPVNPRDWNIANPEEPINAQNVSITIKFGTKGSYHGMDHGDKIGPTRTILIPLTLALKWDEYRRTRRNKAFAKWMSEAKGAARIKRAKQAVHLFLREEDGKRFTGKEFYTVWTGVVLPVPGWSPHKGRHWWACEVLWHEMKKYKNPESGNSETPLAVLQGAALSVIQMIIQPQLGHADSSTTMIYLRWVMNMFSVAVNLNDSDADDYELWRQVQEKAKV
jgi:hypothetical protein